MKFTDDKKIRSAAYGMILFGLVSFAACKIINRIDKCDGVSCEQEKTLLVSGVVGGVSMLLGLNTYNPDLPQRQKRDEHGRFVSPKKRTDEDDNK